MAAATSPTQIADRLRAIGDELAGAGRQEDAIAAFFGALAVLLEDTHEAAARVPATATRASPALLI